MIDPDDVLFCTEDRPEDSVYFKEMYEEFIQSLSEREFRIYYKRFVDGFTQAETAEHYHVVQNYISKVERRMMRNFEKIKKSWAKR